MCGLVGASGDLSGNKKKIFEDLLTVDVVRGPHSTGAGLVDRYNKNAMTVVKTVGPPSELFSQADYQKMMKASAKAFIGHNRYATTGKVVDENAHPFLFPGVLGAHNGTLEYQCRHKLYEADKFGTDSEAIFSHINKYGFDETTKFIHNPSFNNNAWALSWYDSVEDTINLARNKERPLYYVYSEDMCTMFWASEIDMLRWVLRRNGTKIAEDKAYLVGENYRYTWKIPTSIAHKFEHPTVSQVPVPAKLETSWKDNFTDSWQSGNHGTYYCGASSSKTTVSNVLDFNFNKKQKERLEIDTKKWKPPYKDHNGVAIGKARLMEKITDGCTFCSPSKAAMFKENFKWGDFLFFCRPDVDGHQIFLCEDCYNDTEIKNLCKELM